MGRSGTLFALPVVVFPLRFASAALLAVLASAAPTAGRAEPLPRRLEFDDRFRPFQWPDAAQSAATLGAYAYLEFQVEHPTEGHWHDPILFDTGARDALLAQTPAGRRTADLVSDIAWYGPMLLPWLEGLAVPLATDRGNYRVALQLTALNAQAVSVVALLTRAGHKLIARERPDVEPCLANPAYNEQCFGGAFASFPSGHVSAGLVGAGLSCAHHAYLPLYGGGAADTIVCVGATALGVAGGIARISADRHYLTDVIAGGVLGWGVGYAMPVLLHYEWRAVPRATAWTITPWATSDMAGLAALGLW